MKARFEAMNTRRTPILASLCSIPFLFRLVIKLESDAGISYRTEYRILTFISADDVSENRYLHLESTSCGIQNARIQR